MYQWAKVDACKMGGIGFLLFCSDYVDAIVGTTDINHVKLFL